MYNNDASGRLQILHTLRSEWVGPCGHRFNECKLEENIQLISNESKRVLLGSIGSNQFGILSHIYMTQWRKEGRICLEHMISSSVQVFFRMTGRKGHVIKRGIGLIAQIIDHSSQRLESQRLERCVHRKTFSLKSITGLAASWPQLNGDKPPSN